MYHCHYCKCSNAFFLPLMDNRGILPVLEQPCHTVWQLCRPTRLYWVNMFEWWPGALWDVQPTCGFPVVLSAVGFLTHPKTNWILAEQQWERLDGMEAFSAPSHLITTQSCRIRQGPVFTASYWHSDWAASLLPFPKSLAFPFSGIISHLLLF